MLKLTYSVTEFAEETLLNVRIEKPLVFILANNIWLKGLPRWLSGTESTCNAGDMGLILGWGRYPKEGNGNLLKYLAWEIPQTENVASYSP